MLSDSLILNFKKSYMEMDSQLDESVLDKMQTTTQEKSKKLSAIEKLFNPKDVELEEESILRQVGYDLFTSPAGLKGNTTGKFNPSYKLSVGEKVNLYLEAIKKVINGESKSLFIW